MASPSSSYSASGSAMGSQADLPIVNCPHCNRKLVSRICRKGPNAGKRFFKCTRLEQTPQACPFYKFEDDYEEWLVHLGVINAAAAPAQPGAHFSLQGINNALRDVHLEVADLRKEVACNTAILKKDSASLNRLMLMCAINIVLLVAVFLSFYGK